MRLYSSLAKYLLKKTSSAEIRQSIRKGMTIHDRVMDSEMKDIVAHLER